MPASSNLLIILATNLLLVAIASARVQANPFVCQSPQAEASLSQFRAGTVRGELKVDGKKVSLAHAYAVAIDPIWQDDRTLRSDKSASTGWAVLLTEQAIPQNLLEKLWLGKGVFTKSALEGGIRGLLVDLKDTKGYSLTFLYPPSLGWGLSTHQEGIQPGKVQITSNQIVGDVVGSAPLIQKFEYQFSFKAPIQRYPFSTRLLIGESALNSTPVKVYLTYMDALRQRNLEQMRSFLKDENLQAVNKVVAAIGEEQFFSDLQTYIQLIQELNRAQTITQQELEALKLKISQLRISQNSRENPTLLPQLSALLSVLPGDRTTLRRHLHKVVLRGREAKIVLKVNETSVNRTVSLSLGCEQGLWKL